MLYLSNFVGKSVAIVSHKSRIIRVFAFSLSGTQGGSSEDLHTQLQDWVDQSPIIEVTGIQLQVVPCSTYIGGEASCEIQEPSDSTPTEIQVVGPGEASSTALGGVTLYAVIGGGVAVLLIVAIVIGALVLAVRKKCRSKKYETNR